LIIFIGVILKDLDDIFISFDKFIKFFFDIVDVAVRKGIEITLGFILSLHRDLF